MYCECGNIVENEDTGLCASCGSSLRRQVKAFEKKQAKFIEKRNNRNKSIISRVSKSQKARMTKYYERVAEWKKDKVCAICGEKPIDCHHMKGRAGPLLLDERYWLPVCRDHHNKITTNSKWAIENGYSLLRSTK